jgi:hypothetical protein
MAFVLRAACSKSSELGENKEGGKLISSKALSIGVQTSKKIATFFEPCR